MPELQVSVVYDHSGRILSVARVSDDAKVVVLSGDGQSLLVVEIEEEDWDELISSRRVDIDRKVLVPVSPNPAPHPARRGGWRSMGE